MDKEFAQRTSCSNRVADQTLRGQLFLNEFKKRTSGLEYHPKQEWRLFLLHNMATMGRKEHQRFFQGSQSEMAELAPEHPSMWTLFKSPDSEILKVAEQGYRGSM